MAKDETVVLRFKTEEDLNKSLAILSKNAKREILPPLSTGFYVKVSKYSLKFRKYSNNVIKKG